MKILLLLIVVLPLLFINSAQAASDKIIEGFAKYQASRIENIIIDNILLDISENLYFKQYFTKTSNAISNYSDISGKRIIPLLQDFVKKDFKNFDIFAKCIVENINTDIKANITDGDLTQVTAYFKKLQEDLEKEDFRVSDYIANNCKHRQDSAFATNENSVGDILVRNVGAIVKNVKDFEDDNSVLSTRRIDYWKNLFEYLKEICETKSGKFDCSVPSTSSYYLRMHYLIKVFGNINLKNGDDFHDFRNRALFLAQLADASKENLSAERVEAIIRLNIDDEFDAYKHKHTGYGLISRYCRKLTCRPNVVLSSYFGVSTGSESVYGPVGIELRLSNFRGYPISIGYAPINIGLPISNELTEKDYSAKLEDIRTDSYYISFSFKNSPFSILYSTQRNVVNNLGVEEDQYFLSIAFDLPVYTIY